MDRNNLYQKIAERDQYRTNMLISGVDGRYGGEKLFVSDGAVVWQTKGAAGLTEGLGRAETRSAGFPAFQGTGIRKLSEGRIFCENIGNEPVMVICGGGHVSLPLIRLAKCTGFSTTVLEDRPQFATHAKEAGADKVICAPFEEVMDRLAGTPDTYFVIVTRGHQYDTVCLKLAVQKDHAYIGMMGSRKRAGLVKDQLMAAGIGREQLEQVHTPVGLPIGAETPEEIAVSVMAQIIQVKNAAKKSDGYTKELLSYLTGDKGSGRRVLSTIIAKKGSGPRKAGTKMLVFEDGTAVGTVGGGSAEAGITEACLRMLRKEMPAQQVITVDLTGKEAADAGMVCGGTMEVLLEEIICCQR